MAISPRKKIARVPVTANAITRNVFIAPSPSPVPNGKAKPLQTLTDSTASAVGHSARGRRQQQGHQRFVSSGIDRYGSKSRPMKKAGTASITPVQAPGFDAALIVAPHAAVEGRQGAGPVDPPGSCGAWPPQAGN